MLAIALLLAQAPAFRHAPTSEFEQRSVEGFTVMVSPAAKADPDKLNPALAFLPLRLKDIEQEIPRVAYRKLKVVRFWVEHDNPETPAMVYHPNPDWLREHGYNVDKVGGVEIGNPVNFIAWHKQQPSMVLHELSHAWEFRFMDEGSKKALTQAYEHAKASGKYDSVLHYDGKSMKAYGMNNQHEYFAEISEAYFGRNDFYPFVRNELKELDPEGYAVVERAWGIKKK